MYILTFTLKWIAILLLLSLSLSLSLRVWQAGAKIRKSHFHIRNFCQASIKSCETCVTAFKSNHPSVHPHFSIGPSILFSSSLSPALLVLIPSIFTRVCLVWPKERMTNTPVTHCMLHFLFLTPFLFLSVSLILEPLIASSSSSTRIPPAFSITRVDKFISLSFTMFSLFMSDCLSSSLALFLFARTHRSGRRNCSYST